MKLYDKIADKSGNAMVELAIAGMTFIVLGMGGVDFGRMYYDSIAVGGAAFASTQYGAFSVVTAGDFAGMQAAGLAESEDVDNVTVTASHFCDCPDNPGVSVSCNQTQCTNYGLPRLYVRSRAQSNFKTMGKYPGIPDSSAIDLTSWMRIR
ncbi:MAG: pilus assembly protein [Bryobacterales bacterium]|nr:pilus assembly protein [Acidobacteriota bacterium]MCB9383851.1 pilus assembly protein [Bryobacterales bacterium]